MKERAVLVRRQGIFSSDEFNVLVAEEILAPDLVKIHGVKWDIALLECAKTLVGRVPVHFNLRAEDFVTFALFENFLSISKIKKHVVLEIHESDIHRHIPAIRHVAQMGYRLAIDDLSSVGADFFDFLLKNLPPSIMPIIKLNMKILHSMDAEEVMSISRTFRRLGYEVFLKGVEHPGHLLGDTNGMQGFLLHRPVEELVVLERPLAPPGGKND